MLKKALVPLCLFERQRFFANLDQCAEQINDAKLLQQISTARFCFFIKQ